MMTSQIKFLESVIAKSGKMMMMLCKKLQPKPTFLGASSSWLFTIHLRFDRNTLPATHFFSTEEAIESTNANGKGTSTNNSKFSDKVEATKTLLTSYGFTNAQISKLYIKRHDLFTCVHPEKTLLPKLDFYRGTIGFSNTDLPRFICSNPTLLTSSLHNQIVPLYNFIKGLLSSDDDGETVLNTLKRSPRIISYSPEKKIAPGISALREAGVPHKHILHLLRHSPTVLGSLCLVETIKRVAEMGIHPNKFSFVQAIRIFTGFSKSTRDKKTEVFRKCGFSDEEILMAFRSNPKCMALSEGNIVKTMGFVVNKMGCQPTYIARNPVVLNFSLEKRIIPRCKVIKYLQAKGFLRINVSLRTILRKKEKDFIDKFVKKYEDDVPDIMDLYLGKLSPQEPILGSKTYVKENGAG